MIALRPHPTFVETTLPEIGRLVKVPAFVLMTNIHIPAIANNPILFAGLHQLGGASAIFEMAERTIDAPQLGV